MAEWGMPYDGCIDDVCPDRYCGGCLTWDDQPFWATDITTSWHMTCEECGTVYEWHEVVTDEDLVDWLSLARWLKWELV